LQALVKGLAAGGLPGGAALVASVAAATSPATLALAFIAHLPQLTYYILWSRWVCAAHPNMLVAALLGVAARRTRRLQVGLRAGCNARHDCLRQLRASQRLGDSGDWQHYLCWSSCPRHAPCCP
jgi:hypothetical protein